MFNARLSSSGCLNGPRAMKHTQSTSQTILLEDFNTGLEYLPINLIPVLLHVTSL